MWSVNTARKPKLLINKENILNIKLKITLLSLFIALPAIILAQDNGEIQDTLSVHLMDESELNIKGKTNVKDFECKLNEPVRFDTLTVPAKRIEQKIALNNAVVQVDTNKFDCGQRKITRDFKKTLKSKDHPNITLNYREIEVLEADSTGAQPKVMCEVDITISDVTKTYSIEFHGIALNGDVLSFQGMQTIDMRAFGLDPPSPLMGLIKVEDEVNVGFSLYVRFVDAS